MHWPTSHSYAQQCVPRTYTIHRNSAVRSPCALWLSDTTWRSRIVVPTNYYAVGLKNGRKIVGFAIAWRLVREWVRNVFDDVKLFETRLYIYLTTFKQKYYHFITKSLKCPINIILLCRFKCNCIFIRGSYFLTFWKKRKENRFCAIFSFLEHVLTVISILV